MPSSSRLRNLFDHGHTHEQVEAQAVVHHIQAPKISDLAQSFVNALNTKQLSEFLIWMLYYDIVEIPVSPDAWYSTIDQIQTRGWVALGEFLAETSSNMDTSHGMELVVLDSICDRINLQRSTVHSLLIQFADPEKMVFSQIATTIHNATNEQLASLESLEAVQAKLHELNKLITRLQPAEDSMYELWQAMISKRIRGLLHLVIGPRIANIRAGTPLITAATSENLPKEVKEGIELKFRFEATLLKRNVPLTRYGIYPTTALFESESPASSLDNMSSRFSHETQEKQELERARNHAIYLMAENHELRAQIARLQADKRELTRNNEELEQKFSRQNLS